MHQLPKNYGVCLQKVKLLLFNNSELSLYAETTGKFKCFDGKAEISYDYVNDDYCDCSDGSDEPGISRIEDLMLGTSACPTGQFYCKNSAYNAVMINNNKVNDGICGIV